jgi:hypothetical protein
LENTFQRWLTDKTSYLTEYTLKLIEKEWRECGLEDIILKELFSLWVQTQSEGSNWEPQIAELSVKDATKYAKRMAEIRKESFCRWLTKSLGLMRNWYIAMAPGKNVMES